MDDLVLSLNFWLGIPLYGKEYMGFGSSEVMPLDKSV